VSTPQWRPVGSIRGPAGQTGPSWEVLPFSMQGSLRVMSGAGRYPIKGGTYRLETVAATVEVPPLGTAIVVDVRVNGVSIYAGHDDRRPTIQPGQHDADVGAHNPTIVTDGGYVNVDVVAVGSVLPGQFLVVAARLQQIVAADATLAGQSL
jgi:hypothetical protein